MPGAKGVIISEHQPAKYLTNFLITKVLEILHTYAKATVCRRFAQDDKRRYAEPW
jgi:hypothetical protein